MAAVFGQVDGIRSTWSAAMFSCRRYKLQSRIQMNFLSQEKSATEKDTHTSFNCNTVSILHLG